MTVIELYDRALMQANAVAVFLDSVGLIEENGFSSATVTPAEAGLGSPSPKL